jgi:hypothetical protein
VETILARLIPSALSENGQEEIETMLDDLAANRADTVKGERGFPRSFWMLGSGIAAAAAGVLLVFQAPGTEAPAPVVATPLEAPSGLVLVSESDRIESMVDEGWSEDGDGLAMRSLRMNVVEESRFLDEETGIVMQFSQPREEVLLMPVSAF